VLTIRIDALELFQPHLHGGSIGETHAHQVREIIAQQQDDPESVILDFSGVKGATASYLKRLINPFFLPPGDLDGFPREIAPILINVDSNDLKEEIEDFLTGKGRVLILADRKTDPPKFSKLLGQLGGAAAETFQELQALKRTTAAELYGRHQADSSNQTVWNHRLLQLVDLRVARRNREGRFWIYEPTVQI
jgi:hypothetical protein